MDATTLLPYARNQLHPEVQTWFSSAEIERRLLRGLDEDIKWLTSDEYPALFMKNCPVEGAQLADYRMQHLEISPDLAVVAGIRFEGLDLDKPFVGVAHQSRLPTTGSELEHLVDSLMDAFVVFKPRCVRLFQPSQVPLPTSESLAISGDVRYLAAPLSRMRQLPEPPSLDRVRLVAATDLDFYPAYEAAYRQLYGERPWLEAVARVEVREDLQELVGGGLVFEVLVDAVWAGIMVVRIEMDKGLRGYYVVEIVLNESARGAGLGVSVQRRAAELLDKSQARVIYGTIGARNIPALKTAGRAGRIDIGGDYWIAKRNP